MPTTNKRPGLSHLGLTRVITMVSGSGWLHNTQPETGMAHFASSSPGQAETPHEATCIGLLARPGLSFPWAFLAAAQGCHASPLRPVLCESRQPATKTRISGSPDSDCSLYPRGAADLHGTNLSAEPTRVASATDAAPIHEYAIRSPIPQRAYIRLFLFFLPCVSLQIYCKPLRLRLQSKRSPVPPLPLVSDASHA